MAPPPLNTPLLYRHSETLLEFKARKHVILLQYVLRFLSLFVGCLTERLLRNIG